MTYRLCRQQRQKVSQLVQQKENHHTRNIKKESFLFRQVQFRILLVLLDDSHPNKQQPTCKHKNPKNDEGRTLPLCSQHLNFCSYDHRFFDDNGKKESDSQFLFTRFF